MPARKTTGTKLTLPDDSAYADAKKGSGKQKIATTMAFVRLLKDLMRDKEFGKRFVPIIPDEARTFGMDSLFPTAKIYSPHGQNYTPVDRDLFLSYKESTTGQILHEGINEAGSVASFTAAGTSYATHGEPMIPLYIFYSMFGFQRTADGLWAAADQMARGFVLGATAGRTTLNGEGLQHEDGHSLLLAATNPAVVGVRPGVRVRDRAHRRGRSAPDVRRRAGEHLLLPDALQRADRAAGRAGRTSTCKGCSRACTGSRPAPAGGSAAGADSRLRCRAAVGAQGAGSCSPPTGASRPTSGR